MGLTQISAARTKRKLAGRPVEKGQILVEFALVAMIFFLLIFGIIDFARLFQSWEAVQHAARLGARYAVTGQVQCTGYTDNRTACILLKAKTATAGLHGGGGGGTDVSVSLTSWPHQAGGTFGAAVADSAGSQCDKMRVTVSYHHHFVLPVFQLLAPSGVNMSGTQDMLNEPFGPC